MVSRDHHHDSDRHRTAAEKPCIPPGHLVLRRSPHRGVKTETLSLNQRVTREGENRTIYPAGDPDVTGHRAHSGRFRDPKISDPLGRYCMAVFTGGVNIGPYGVRVATGNCNWIGWL